MLTVILTGGDSRRMGCDKATLPWGGATLLQTLIDRYAALGPVAVSVNAAGRFPFAGAAELVDRAPGLGPLNGVASAFAETDAEEIFLTATDLPYGDPALAVRLSELRGTADACLLAHGRKGIEPVFAVYGRRCGAAAAACLAAGKKSFRDMLADLDVRLVRPEELRGFDLGRILTNVNTPEDYAALRAAPPGSSL